MTRVPLAAAPLLALLAAGVAGCVPPAPLPPPPAGFTPLFDGRTLEGWHVSRTSHQGTTPDVRVEDGAIVLRQDPYGQGGVLLTDRRYADFELYLEVLPDAGTNGGIFFRSTESGSAYQVEVEGAGLGGTGNLLGEMLRVTTSARAEGLREVWREGEWNSFRLRVEGAIPRVALWVNDVLMWDTTAVRNDAIADARTGYIGLQTHWSATYTQVPGGSCCERSWKPGAAHRYRNLWIRELP
jgi:hypothetical protein